MLRAAIDALLWSSLWLATAAALLTTACARALGLDPAPPWLGLAFGGTLFVYAIDRLRDLARDRGSAPARTAFVERHRTVLVSLAAIGVVVAAACALPLPPPALALMAAVAALGLLHRRLKRWLVVKPAYLTFAWTAVPVGLPAASDASAQHVAPVAFVVGTTVLANVALSNLRDREGLAGRLGTRRALGLAAGLCAVALTAALLGPMAVRPLAALPLAMAAAVGFFRPTERYGAGVVDGALLVGAVIALGWPAP